MNLRHLLLVGLVGCTIATCSSAASAREWTGQQRAWAAAALGLSLVDWGQTRHIARHPEKYRELNPLLGKHPSLGDVNRHRIVTTGLLMAAAHWLPEHRDLILKVWVGVQVANTARNFTVGLKVDF